MENSSNVFNNQLRIFGYFHFPFFLPLVQSKLLFYVHRNPSDDD